MNLITKIRNLLYYEESVNASNNGKSLNGMTILLWVIVLLYVLSPIDIIPEKVVRPIAFGFIDDIILFGIVYIITNADMKRFATSQTNNDISETLSFGEDIEPEVDEEGISGIIPEWSTINEEKGDNVVDEIEHESQRENSEFEGCTNSGDSDICNSNPFGNARMEGTAMDAIINSFGNSVPSVHDDENHRKGDDQF